jgi:aspartyl-tRNA(Asn)/glutamyl-tRNA(Gln) amidotransferase subunit B
VTNQKAVRLAVRAALALDCTLHEKSIFARKNYFYPDLPKGYQISQYERPFSTAGHLDVETESGKKRVRITRIHMEEDAGKTVHGMAGESVVDLNRAGTPLVEIVSEPDIASSTEAAAYMRSLRDILVFAGVNDGNLEEGSLRCDANVSIRPKGTTTLGTRTELKNLNSFRFVQKAIDVEIARQIAVLDGGGKVVQETRGFDPDTGKTHSLRSKEDAHDYRYFPDPDLPPIEIDQALIQHERAAMGRLPAERRTAYVELGLSPATAATLTQHPAYAEFFERTLKTFDQPVKAANWIQTEVLRDAKVHGTHAEFSVTPEQVAELLDLVAKGEISGKQAKDVHVEMAKSKSAPRTIVEKLGLKVVGSEDTLLPLCQKLLADNPKQADALRGGKKALMGYFVGQVMKETGGTADPKVVTAIFERLIAGG